jgi:hypothetical protein
LPDVGTWMRRIAGGVERIAGIKSAETSTEPPTEEGYSEAEPSNHAGIAPSDEPPGQSVKDKELTHA